MSHLKMLIQHNLCLGTWIVICKMFQFIRTMKNNFLGCPLKLVKSSWICKKNSTLWFEFKSYCIFKKALTTLVQNFNSLLWLFDEEKHFDGTILAIQEPLFTCPTALVSQISVVTLTVLILQKSFKNMICKLH